VSLCHGAGMSHPEIAAAINLPLGTVKSHVKRGLDKLRARLQPVAADGRSLHVG
jgi:DNA-directed RNA polymerase specialized sigma24 family protein